MVFLEILQKQLYEPQIAYFNRCGSDIRRSVTFVACLFDSVALVTYMVGKLLLCLTDWKCRWLAGFVLFVSLLLGCLAACLAGNGLAWAG